jgi:hypothetical protein
MYIVNILYSPCFYTSATIVISLSLSLLVLLLLLVGRSLCLVDCCLEIVSLSLSLSLLANSKDRGKVGYVGPVSYRPGLEFGG